MADGIAAFQEAVRLDPDNAAHHVDLGRALNADERDEAVKAFREAVLLEPDNATYHADLGRALNALGRFDQADAAFEKAVRLDPDNAIHQKERIVNYVISLADWRSDKHDLEHRGVQWDDYIYNVRCITITQLPNIRIPYQNWSQTEDAQLATRRAIAPKIRRRRWVFFSLILISAVAGVIITSFLSRLIGSRLRSSDYRANPVS